MGYIFALITIVVYVLYIAMLLRMLFDWVRMFAPEWRPKGIVLLFASGVYAVTDWPMNQLRRLIPPVRVGNVAFGHRLPDSDCSVVFVAEHHDADDRDLLVSAYLAKRRQLTSTNDRPPPA